MGGWRWQNSNNRRAAVVGPLAAGRSQGMRRTSQGGITVVMEGVGDAVEEVGGGYNPSSPPSPICCISPPLCSSVLQKPYTPPPPPLNPSVITHYTCRKATSIERINLLNRSILNWNSSTRATTSSPSYPNNTVDMIKSDFGVGISG
ncbi:unnamed protein product [Lactuca saligna]|uniref:Uncharacterized protein n=1 Tax=Lactuca saligna TaxID=75948 RepID=A0AA35Z7X2_LACSI|nr:unnamed protein product [Lactuca saligna]